MPEPKKKDKNQGKYTHEWTIKRLEYLELLLEKVRIDLANGQYRLASQDCRSLAGHLEEFSSTLRLRYPSDRFKGGEA